MGGGLGRTSYTMAGHGGARQRGKRGGRGGERGTGPDCRKEEAMEGAMGGRVARGARSAARALLLLCSPGPVRDCCVRKKGKRRERKREKERKRK
jgi:hypothetical protein